ncbi:uncharacterized protein PV07_11281 [Cladophialophora immunda]|uniref:Uncharacterized protein n=1 Tax=Cladophialophora immunda TaxID=569365 RepID=A0A0D2CHP8_9EURO|nr:uncharacterized protein PV07_11281 [Cladophialophora immunda]KIW23049.1 hypothetical protein PV07_11281 [Cladophialophora immunda]
MVLSAQDQRGRDGARRDNEDQRRHDDDCLPPSGKKGSTQNVRNRNRDRDSDNDEELQTPIHIFVPGEKLDTAVLVEYVAQYLDRAAKITSAHHPTDKTRTGFSVTGKGPLNAANLRDLINDSKDWDLERQSKEYRRNPYDYRDSDTAQRRARKGPSEGSILLGKQSRQTREAHVASGDSPVRRHSYGASSQSQPPPEKADPLNATLSPLAISDAAKTLTSNETPDYPGSPPQYKTEALDAGRCANSRVGIPQHRHHIQEPTPPPDSPPEQPLAL